jgi:hypothetical protein
MTKLGKPVDTTIQSLEHYNSAMARPLFDKIWFADKVNGATIFIDYGCADGTLLRFLARNLPDCEFLGYDADPEMISIAEKTDKLSNVEFSSNWDDVRGTLLGGLAGAKLDSKKICLILSSIVHEVYAYRRNEVDKFWTDIFGSRADYIALRDMVVSDTTARQSDPISVARIRQRYQPDALRAFEATWGSLNDNWALVHFLLKYRYQDGWDRELRENYLPLSLERLLALIPTNYEPIFMEHYTLPFLREQVMKDFGIQLQDRTHLKLLLKRAG